MKIYHYHPETKKYVGVSEADRDPLVRGRFLIPAHATELEPPPETQKNKVAVFVGDAWQLVDTFFTPENELPALTDAEKLSAIRLQRDRLLDKSDWTQLNDAPLTDEERSIWAGYRFILRNFPVSVDLNNVIWPPKPEL